MNYTVIYRRSTYPQLEVETDDIQEALRVADNAHGEEFSDRSEAEWEPCEVLDAQGTVVWSAAQEEEAKLRLAVIEALEEKAAALRAQVKGEEGCPCSAQGCVEHPEHDGSDHTWEQHHNPIDHEGDGPCRCDVYAGEEATID